MERKKRRRNRTVRAENGRRRAFLHEVSFFVERKGKFFLRI